MAHIDWALTWNTLLAPTIKLIYNNKHKAHELSFCLSMQTTVCIFIIPGKAVILIIFYNFIFIITVLKLYNHLVHNSKVTKGFPLLAPAFHTPSKSFWKLPSFIEFIRWSSRELSLYKVYNVFGFVDYDCYNHKEMLNFRAWWE